MKRLLLLNRVFVVWKDQTGQYLDIEPDLRHAPLINNQSGCNYKVSFLDGRESPILRREDATRYRSACMRLSFLAQDRSDLAETAKHLEQRMSETREFDFIPLKRAARCRG